METPKGGADKAVTAVDRAQVRVFLRPIAPPAALGLAAFSGSTIIVATWITRWWGDADSPKIFFPFVGLWGGLAQFLAGLYGIAARDTLVSVVNTIWGSFWMAIGILYAFVVSESTLSSAPREFISTNLTTLSSGCWSCRGPQRLRALS